MSFTKDAAQAVENNLERELQVAGISPTLIETVVEMVLGLFANCANKQALKQGMENPGRLERSLVRSSLRQELREHGQTVSREELDRLTDCCLQAARTADPEAREKLVEYTSQYGSF